MVNWLGLLVPIAYLGILVGALATFSSLYRKRKADSAASLEPWFPSHLQRNIYLSLLHLEPAPGQEKAPNVPDSVLKAALLQRACEDIRRILSLRNSKQALSTLLQRGSVGDELWQRFQRGEKELEAELQDVVEEANALQAGWGQVIFQSANEMVNNNTIREKMAEIQAKGKAEKERWEQEKANVKSEFLKELDEEDTDATKGEGTGREKTSSDEDAVMVDGGGPAATGSAASKGSAKKRKAKK